MEKRAYKIIVFEFNKSKRITLRRILKTKPMTSKEVRGLCKKISKEENVCWELI